MEDQKRISVVRNGILAVFAKMEDFLDFISLAKDLFLAFRVFGASWTAFVF